MPPINSTAVQRRVLSESMNSWHYWVTHAGQSYTELVFSYPDASTYSIQISQVSLSMESGDILPVQVIWDHDNGNFNSRAEALQFSDWLISRRAAPGARRTDRR